MPLEKIGRYIKNITIEDVAGCEKKLSCETVRIFIVVRIFIPSGDLRLVNFVLSKISLTMKISAFNLGPKCYRIEFSFHFYISSSVFLRLFEEKKKKL